MSRRTIRSFAAKQVTITASASCKRLSHLNETPFSPVESPRRADRERSGKNPNSASSGSPPEIRNAQKIKEIMVVGAGQYGFLKVRYEDGTKNVKNVNQLRNIRLLINGEGNRDWWKAAALATRKLTEAARRGDFTVSGGHDCLKHVYQVAGYPAVLSGGNGFLYFSYAEKSVNGYRVGDRDTALLGRVQQYQILPPGSGSSAGASRTTKLPAATYVWLLGSGADNSEVEDSNPDESPGTYHSFGQYHFRRTRSGRQQKYDCFLASVDGRMFFGHDGEYLYSGPWLDCTCDMELKVDAVLLRDSCPCTTGLDPRVSYIMPAHTWKKSEIINVRKVMGNILESPTPRALQNLAKLVTYGRNRRGHPLGSTYRLSRDGGVSRVAAERFRYSIRPEVKRIKRVVSPMVLNSSAFECLSNGVIEIDSYGNVVYRKSQRIDEASGILVSIVLVAVPLVLRQYFYNMYLKTKFVGGDVNRKSLGGKALRIEDPIGHRLRGISAPRRTTAFV